jgi:hypothetical protein
MANTKRIYIGPDQRIICTTCREVKPVTAFAMRTDTKVPRVRSCCRQCLTTRATAKNREAHTDAQMYWWARSIAKYGMTPESWAEMFAAQGFRCAICDVDANGAKRFHVDHCHETGLVRGILCTKCNVGIGGLKDDPRIVLRAYQYLLRAVLEGDFQDHDSSVSVNPSTNQPGNTEAIRASGETVETTRGALSYRRGEDIVRSAPMEKVQRVAEMTTPRQRKNLTG